PVMTEAPFSPDFLANLEQLRLLGEGGMGTVYAARDRRRQIDVAIKVLKGFQTQDLQRFRREAEVLSRLQHPDIVPFIDSGVDGELPYIICELIEGTTLRAQLKTGPMVLGQILEILGTLAAALAFAHSQDVIHRDVKPENVFLTKSGGLKLGDFGLSSLTTSNSLKTATGMLMGTPAYMSPEQ